MKGLGNWFDARDAVDFGESLAAFFVERISTDAALKDDKKSTAKRREVLNKMSQQVVRFKLEHKTNMYQRAKFANSFKWKLRDAGYESSFVDSVTKFVLLQF